MLVIKTILCPVDFSDVSEHAVRYAAAFAKQYHSRLLIYHWLPSVMTVSVYPEGMPVAAFDWHDSVKKQMEKFLSLIKLYDINLDSKIATGDASTGILKTAVTENADLIVMGTHGMSGYEAILMGSVTNKVLHKATVPVLAVCKATKTVLSGDPDQPLLIGKILCPVDPTNIRLEMLSHAMSLARSNRSTIFFLTVGEPSQTNQVLHHLREVILPQKEELCKVEFIHDTGDAVEGILKMIQRLEIDLVVMGHHSRIAATIETVGSITLRVIPRSNCAVLVVRD